jgi:tetratricopeptide (TPR) repeat protein
MDFQLKPISREAIPEALQKAERYRLINDPAQAESICQDVVAVDPQNQQALVTLLLAITDQFGAGGSVTRAREILRRLENAYDKAYYEGIIWERSARAQMRQGSPNSSFTAYDSFRRAMECYDSAQSLRPSGNDDAILRWNCCVRTLMQNQNLRPRPDEVFEPVQGE